ncbi:MAG: hypothetical protein M3Y56_14525, partial [Armatimonadota bacterium]|nr:hypothetical protein [Armatimonadota bacterium]
MTTRKKAILSLFILFHLTTIFIWTLPDSYIRQVGMPLVWDYIDGMGLWQEWGMFAPDPSNLNMYIFARVQQSDGSTWEYWLPQLDKMNLVDRYQNNRFRAYVETAHLDSSDFIWPDLAGWIAEQDRQQTGKRPIRIRLYRTWWNIPLP